MLFDFSIAARGYGLCLAFFVWALYFAMERRFLLAGCLLGLSVASNLTILFPVLALIAAVAFVDRRLKPFLYLAVPAFFLAACFTYPSLRRSQREDFYIGYTNFHTAFTDLVRTTLYAKPDTDGFLRPRDKIEAACVYLLPAALLLAAAASFRARPLLLPLSCLILTLMSLILANHLIGLNYPAERTCLYFIVLAAISWAIAGDAVDNRLARALCLLPMILLSIQSATQLQTNYFQFWWPEADDKVIAGLIQRDAAGKPENSLAVSATWLHQPSLEFYRRSLRIDALKPVERLEPTPVTGFDFYVLGAADWDRAKSSHLRTVFSDPAADVTLAEPNPDQP
jgi:hypothetical protein